MAAPPPPFMQQRLILNTMTKDTNPNQESYDVGYYGQNEYDDVEEAANNELESKLAAIIEQNPIRDIGQIYDRLTANSVNNPNSEQLRLYRNKLVLLSALIGDAYFVNGKELADFREYIRVINMTTIPTESMMKYFLPASHWLKQKTEPKPHFSEL